MREKQRETERPRQRDKDRKTKNLTVKTVGLILLSQAPHCTTKYFKTNKTSNLKLIEIKITLPKKKFCQF